MKRNDTIGMLALVLCLATAACGGDDSGVELTVHLDQAQAWEMTGAPVDAGLVCAEGSRMWLTFYDLEGDPLTPEEGWERLENVPPDGQADLTVDIEHSCSDGSGGFMVNERPGMNVVEWTIVDGWGASEGISGQGTCEIEAIPWEEGDPEEDRETGVDSTLRCEGDIYEG